MKDIRKHSIVKVNNETYNTTKQWGVMDARTLVIVRAASTRQVARNFAKRSKFLKVVSRDIVTEPWEVSI